MAVTIFQISRWYKMLIGKSAWHVNQNVGEYFSSHELCGYYNNMTEKVTIMPQFLDNDDFPQLNLAGGKLVYFPVAIFQYGLGCYDLYLETNEDKYLSKVLQCADWAYRHLDEKGRWNNFFYIYPEHPYGAMAQGEGVSLMLRAYKVTNDNKFLSASKRAIDFMLQPIEAGGTTIYSENDVIFAEYTHLPIVLNGFIFAWWGLYDYVNVINDNGWYKSKLEASLNSLINILPKFRCSFWSKYDFAGKIASPFYHNLHIAQMQAMYVLTKKSVFNEYASIWEKQQHNGVFKAMAFAQKAFQKIIEK